MQNNHRLIVECLERWTNKANEPAKLAVECSRGWSERSEAEPWVQSLFTNQARLSGRKKLRRLV